MLIRLKDTLFYLIKKGRGMYLLLPFLLLLSCNKDPLTEAAPSLIGKWRTYDNEGVGEQVEIYENGNGVIKTFDFDKENTSTKERTWYIKDNELHFGKAAFNGEFYDIDAYPQTAGSILPMGIDSILPGERYTVLDERNYKEIN